LSSTPSTEKKKEFTVRRLSRKALKIILRKLLVVHTGNPSYLGDGGRRIGLKPAWAKSW
jgi:hypothetical protein